MASRLRLRLASPSPSHILTTATSTPAHDTTPTQNSTAHKQLLSYEDLPQWYRDNEHIKQGYRPVSGSVAVSFRSLLYMHNESVNIYSHLLLALFFIVSEGIVLRHLHSKYANVTTQDDIIFSFFILTAVICLSLSACYHTLTNHSESMDSIWLRIDFIGIIILTLGDFISGIYMVFWCEPTLRIIYWAMVTPPSSLSTRPLTSIDCNPLRRRHLHSSKSSFSRPFMAHIPSIMLRGNRCIWLCASRPRYLSIRLLADDEAVWYAVLSR